ncbi:MAG: N-formylglutamate deformylase [Gammaproteobacteria bacterium]|nr:N-formylglutamate deformylase [Gammaproteobacteria bacterium]
MSSGSRPPWLEVQARNAPLLLCMPHTGTEIPLHCEPALASGWRARKDTDWYVERLYESAQGLGASVVRTRISRTVIDPNRDPSGASLYPGQATTELCPTTTFDGEPLYRSGQAPAAADIEARRAAYFRPYHAAVAAELERLRSSYPRVVLYDCHSIRSRVPRLFPGLLPHFNIGTYSGASCDARLTRAVEAVCDAPGYTRVTDGRFKGGYTTRHYGRPAHGVHALQMELACRGYLREPSGELDPENWPCPWDADFARPLQLLLERVLEACLRFARDS